MRREALLHAIREAVARGIAGLPHVEEWMQQADVLTQTREWLSDEGVDPRAARVVLAYVYMSCGAGEVFEEGNAADRVMRCEVKRFYAAMQASLGGTHRDFPAAVSRARRFYRAWSVGDRDRTVTYLLASLRDASRQAPQDTAATLALVRAVGGAAAYQRGLSAARVAPLSAQVAAVAERAFWDVVKEQVAEGNYDGLYALLGELQEALLALVANAPREREKINDRFDADWIRQQGEHGCLTTETIQAMVGFLLATITDWCAPADDRSVRAWEERVRKELDATRDLPVADFVKRFLVSFLSEAFGHVQHMYRRVAALRRERNDG